MNKEQENNRKNVTPEDWALLQRLLSDWGTEYSLSASYEELQIFAEKYGLSFGWHHQPSAHV